MPTKHGPEAAKEMKALLKKSVGQQLPTILETPPHPLLPEKFKFTADDFNTFCDEINHSDNIALIQIGLAKENVRTQKAYHAFEREGIHPKEFTHIGYYHLPPTKEGEPTPTRYMLLW